MADLPPVSWLEIRPGWKVLAEDGAEIGEVDEVVGDERHDIFDGLSVVTSALGKPRYVAAEQVARITDGHVELALDAAAVTALEHYEEPASSLQVVPDDHRGAGEAIASEGRRLERVFLAPTQRHARSPNLLTRVLHWLRRRRG